MPSVTKTNEFRRRADGSIETRDITGKFRSVASQTDTARLKRLTDAEIEAMAGSDPDHPPLDDAFWEGARTEPTAKEAISIKLDADVLAYFRGQGRGYQTRINAILRHYVETRSKSR